jgi:hypothetical protein
MVDTLAYGLNFNILLKDIYIYRYGSGREQASTKKIGVKGEEKRGRQ